MEIKPSTFATSLTPTPHGASKPKSTAVTEADPSKTSLQQIDSNNIGYAGTPENKPLSGHIVTDAAAATPATELTREEVAHALNQVIGNLTPFFVPCDESNASHIFVLNEKGDAIELEDNKLDPDFRDTHHEAAKAHFIANYEALYGKALLDTFYPEKLRKEPLTLGQAHLLREQLNEFQQSVEAACQGDPSKYDATLKAQLETVHQLEKAVNTTFESEGPLKTEVTSLGKYLSEQTGVSPETIHNCLLAGAAIAAVATTASGLGLPAALHATATAILSHGSAVTSTAAITAKGTPLAASIANQATAMSSVSLLHNLAAFTTHAGTTALVGAGIGGTLGAAGGFCAATANGVDHSTGWISIPLLTTAGMLAGATGGGVLGLATGAIGSTATAVITGGLVITTGAAVGALGGGLLGATTGNHATVLGGIVAGAVVGGASAAVVVGGGVYLFGGLCSYVAHLATTAATVI
jgi:hypothetical protein